MIRPLVHFEKNIFYVELLNSFPQKQFGDQEFAPFAQSLAEYLLQAGAASGLVRATEKKQANISDLAWGYSLFTSYNPSKCGQLPVFPLR